MQTLRHMTVEKACFGLQEGGGFSTTLQTACKLFACKIHIKQRCTVTCSDSIYVYNSHALCFSLTTGPIGRVGRFWAQDICKIISAARLASLPMGDKIRILDVLGLDLPSQTLLARVSEGALDAPVPIFVPRWNRPPAPPPVVHGGNGAAQGDDVDEEDVGEEDVGEEDVGEEDVGEAIVAEDLQPPAAAPPPVPEGPARDALAPLLPAEGCRVQGTRPDDPPAPQPGDKGADASQSAKESKEGKDSGASEQP